MQLRRRWLAAKQAVPFGFLERKYCQKYQDPHLLQLRRRRLARQLAAALVAHNQHALARRPAARVQGQHRQRAAVGLDAAGGREG